jgi:hypothetical protein
VCSSDLLEQQKKEETSLTVESIPGITLAEFARRDIAVEIYSEFLQCDIWLCSNDEIASQLKKDASEQVCYTLDEIRSLSTLNPSPESLKKIHEAKIVFPNSKLKEIIQDIDNKAYHHETND